MPSRHQIILTKALREARAAEWQHRAASILLGVNGLDNALAYVCGLVQYDLAPGPQVVQLCLFQEKGENDHESCVNLRQSH